VILSITALALPRGQGKTSGSEKLENRKYENQLNF